MYLKEIEITFIEPCLADAERIRVKANPSADISEIMPYLNVVVKGCSFVPDKNILTFMKEQRIITLFPRQITITKSLNTTDAMQVLDWLKDLINETYEKKEEIEPSYKSAAPVRPLEVFKLLPRTNCKECGENTCLAFAAKLLLWEQDLKNCNPLNKLEYSELKDDLIELLEPMGVDIPKEWF